MTEKIQIQKNGRNGWYRVIVNVTDHNSVGVVINNKDARQFMNELRDVLGEPIEGNVDEDEVIIKYIPKIIEKEVVQEKVKIVEKTIVIEVPKVKIIEKNIDYTVNNGLTPRFVDKNDVINFLNNSTDDEVSYILHKCNIEFGDDNEVIVIDDEEDIPFGQRKTKIVPAINNKIENPKVVEEHSSKSAKTQIIKNKEPWYKKIWKGVFKG